MLTRLGIDLLDFSALAPGALKPARGGSLALFLLSRLDGVRRAFPFSGCRLYAISRSFSSGRSSAARQNSRRAFRSSNQRKRGTLRVLLKSRVSKSCSMVVPSCVTLYLSARVMSGKDLGPHEEILDSSVVGSRLCPLARHTQSVARDPFSTVRPSAMTIHPEVSALLPPLCYRDRRPLKSPSARCVSTSTGRTGSFSSD